MARHGSLKFLIIGDVVGRLGRDAVSQALPDLRATLQPDSVIINIENIAHGAGVSPQAWAQAKSWAADVYTTGDHAWDNKAGLPLLANSSPPIIRPANYPDGVTGRGYHVYTIGAYQIAVINLQGQVFFRRHPLNPFHFIDELLNHPDIKNSRIKLVDFHAEATSEKRALGLHLDGRVSALWGTHTHVPTADAQILPAGTGYISDVGMAGGYHTVIGAAPAGPLKSFLRQMPASFAPPESGPTEVNALELKIEVSTGKTIHIASHRRIMNDR